jgi:porin
VRNNVISLCSKPLIFAVLALIDPVAAKAGDLPVDFSTTDFTDILGNVHGGLKSGALVMNKADVTATLQGDAIGVHGLTAFIDGQVTDGADITGNLVGNALPVSSIEGPASIRLANAWVAQDFDGSGGLKAGVVDLNTEFDVQSTAALFLNSAFGIGPDFAQSGRNGPSIFPSTGLGLIGWWIPGDHWQIKAGLFDGTPGNPDHPGRTTFANTGHDGVLGVIEARYHLTADFVLGAGTWRYSNAFDAIDPAKGQLTGNSGYYAIADGLLYSAPEDDKAGLSGWVRVGFADDRINAFDAVISGGLVYTAPFGRGADQAGISFATAHFGGPARHMSSLNAAESDVEATYSFNVNGHLTVQPDVQYVISPSGDPSLDDALVVGSRVITSW